MPEDFAVSLLVRLEMFVVSCFLKPCAYKVSSLEKFLSHLRSALVQPVLFVEETDSGNQLILI